ncbi:MAG: N-acetyl-gamma-glutamyl-phosphate reductase [Pseudomonadaceae bacterium]|nr:N-acetyl-gamma-glutamyl-phosphate reductase [Pseudomonadaceae bacterium]
MATIFIDGQAGTTGLEITSRLEVRNDLTLLKISDAERKDQDVRAHYLQSADVAILCLPDDAAREAVALAAGKSRILDASTAYRTDPEWAYGLPELNAQQRSNIHDAQYVSNPGCYPQGFILLTRPLIEAGLLDPATTLRCHAVSGYSGGGRQMVEKFRAFDANQQDQYNSQAYGLTLQHKHVPEMHHYSTTHTAPLFTPMVANYYKGMLVQIPLFRREVSNASKSELHGILNDRYAGEPFISVLPLNDSMLEEGFLNPTACNGTNNMQLMLFGNEDQYLLVARYDNLGKGASGAAVQNLNLMLGFEETNGL